eukprot:TRINITY_DN1178_c0_g3_i2.p1 TRINITY_DN1178_c0_g3~~TRINITY_DN1178_c0_g3_i2.p1  ORF type:complete len:165 (-),score=40.44 TRINITY_DN1178_c0_g3_i2:47-541(-)
MCIRDRYMGMPPESEYFPDILLTFDTYKADIYKDTLQSLDRGECLSFNATIKSLGADLRTRHFHATNVEACEGFIELPPHVHDNGRYADKPGFLNVLGDHSHDDHPQKEANVKIIEIKKENIINKDVQEDQSSNQQQQQQQQQQQGGEDNNDIQPDIIEEDQQQ